MAPYKTAHKRHVDGTWITNSGWAKILEVKKKATAEKEARLRREAAYRDLIDAECDWH